MKTFIVLLLSFPLLFSCSRKVAVNQQLYNQLNNQSVDLKKVQFYTHGRFFLEREVSDEGMVALNGKVRMRNGKQIERIVFKHHTKGILEKAEDDVLYLRFEKGENKVLRFKLNTSGYFMLQHDREENGVRYIKYGDKTFAMDVLEDNRNIFVQIKRSKAKDVNRDKRRVKGLKA